jgi:hypothetical protein
LLSEAIILALKYYYIICARERMKFGDKSFQRKTFCRSPTLLFGTSRPPTIVSSGSSLAFCMILQIASLTHMSLSRLTACSCLLMVRSISEDQVYVSKSFSHVFLPASTLPLVEYLMAKQLWDCCQDFPASPFSLDRRTRRETPEGAHQIVGVRPSLPASR